jgi:hypothetical protein
MNIKFKKNPEAFEPRSQTLEGHVETLTCMNSTSKANYKIFLSKVY